MIKLISILFLMLMTSDGYISDWHIMPIDTREDFNGLHFLDEKHGFAVTKQGSIYSFESKRNVWKIEKTKFEYDLENIYFLDNGHRGFAFGTKGVILRTEDVGQTWIRDTIGYGVRFTDMVFFDSLNGVVVGINYRLKKGSDGVAFRTTDGGLSWDSLEVKGWKFESINLSPENVAVITGRQHLLISRDKGKNWYESAIPPRIIPKAAIISGRKGLLVGMGGYLAISNDYGKSWSRMNNIPEEISLFDIEKSESHKYYISGTGGEILCTSDAGYNWMPEASGAVYDLLDIQIKGNIIFVCGKKGTIVYTRLE